MYLAADVSLSNMPNVQSLQGYLTDTTIGTEYRIVNNFSLGLAVNYNVLDFELDKGGNRHRYSQPSTRLCSIWKCTFLETEASTHAGSNRPYNVFASSV